MIIVRRTFDTTGLEIVKDESVLTLTFEEFGEAMTKGATIMFATQLLKNVDEANQPKGIRDFDGNVG